MKTIKVILAAALFTSLATLSFAGPGPQFWDQQTRNAQAQQTKAGIPTKVEAATQVASCAACSCAAMKKS